jgi:putative hydrolase of the HAD superfamily
MTIRSVIFDFHETLISADRWYDMEVRTVAHEILHRLGVWDGEAGGPSFRRIEDSYTRLRAISSVVGVEYAADEVARVALRALGRADIPGDRIARAVDAHFEMYRDDVRAKPGLAAAIAVLRAEGLRLAVISNALHGGFIRRALGDLGLGGRFEAVVVSAELGIRKPRREIFEAALRELGAGAPDFRDLTHLQPDAVVAGLADVPQVLAAWRSEG